MISDGQTLATFHLYQTPLASAGYVDEPNMRRIGDVSVPCTKGEAIELSYKFGSTELGVLARNTVTGALKDVTLSYT